MKYLLAVDIGATSARHVLGHRDPQTGEMILEEIYRFKTPLVELSEGHCYWDVKKLFEEIVTGLKKAKEIGKIPTAIGIDSFGVDYALLDEKGNLIDKVISYRDDRTVKAKENFLSPNVLFEKTGIYPHAFNTIYQLFDDKETGRLARAKEAMMLPSYLVYLLTGTKQNEISILSTSGLMDSRTHSFEPSLLKELGLKDSFFPNAVPGGTKIGGFTKDIQEEVGYNADVYCVLEHDTASAFYGSMTPEGYAYLSSGTWSLFGAMLSKPIVTKDAFEKSFSNELSRPGEVRFLSNIMGMWVVNRLLGEMPEIKNVIEAVKLAEASQYEDYFPMADQRLFNPVSMKETVLELLKEKGSKDIKTPGDLFRSVYLSLAYSYKEALLGLEEMTGEKFKGISIFGGGVQNRFLDNLVEEIVGRPVYLGPSEATSLGNLLLMEENASK